MIRFAEIYDNSEVLSPIDRDTWRLIGETCELDPSKRVIELASGKGAFALFLARRFGCKVEGLDINPDFVNYSNERATEMGLSSRVRFECRDVNSLRVQPEEYDLGVSLGALYMFREAGWDTLVRGVRPSGHVAVSDLFCKKIPPPDDVKEAFFEEDEGGMFTLEDARRWYTGRGMEILREAECSRRAWLEYYDLTRGMLTALARKYGSDAERQAEIKEALWEDELVRKHGEEYLGYMTFIMRRV